MSDGPKPTEMAKFFFELASQTAYPGVIDKKGLSPDDQAEVLRRIAEGLYQMAIGLRATYIEIEEIKRRLK
jgi:hypothetical protein